MRTLSSPLSAAIAAPGGYAPDLKLELADSTPHVASVTSPDPSYYCAVSAISNTGFTLTCVRRDGANVTVGILCNWLAFG